MAQHVVRYKPAASKAAPKEQTWQSRLQKPWSACCDSRAVVAVMLRLHELKKERHFPLEHLIAFIEGGDICDMSSFRRADIIEAFNNRTDVATVVTMLVEYLVVEGVLVPEYEHEGEMYRMNRDEVPTLNSAHASIDRGLSKLAKLHVVS